MMYCHQTYYILSCIDIDVKIQGNFISKNNTASPKFLILYDYSDENITQIEMHNTLSVLPKIFLRKAGRYIQWRNIIVLIQC